MRHQKKRYQLSRTASHRKATLASLSSALIAHKRIRTTFTKAKALRMFVEPILTRAKEDTTANRRQVFRYLQDKEAVKTLFGEIAGKISDRDGGYTRIVKLGQREGDGAEMAVIELVDYNETGAAGTTSGRRRRTRRGTSGTGRSRKGAETTAATPQAQATPAPKATEEKVVNQELGGDEPPSNATAVVEEQVSPEAAVPVPERSETPEEVAPETEQPAASAEAAAPEAEEGTPSEDEEKKAE